MYPMFANKTHELAHSLLKEEKIQESIEMYTKALLETPNHPDIYSDRGVAHLHIGDKKNCFIDFDKAIELQPHYAYRYAARAFAKRNFGDVAGAVLDYEKAVELDPDDAVAQNNLGLLLEEQGYKNQAEKRFERADKLSKMEDHLYEVMDDLEEPEEKATNQDAQERTEIDPIITRDREISTAREMKKIFTSKEQFKDFLKFLKNGFKIK
jgi:tetratricopeptide (TPR) repeat protein